MSRERSGGEVSQSNPAAPRPRFGKYSLIKRLGVGGMAEAWLARSEGASGFQKLCVVKRMLPHLAEDDQFVRMFHAEAKVAALLTHTNVVQIYELGEIDTQHFIAMEYVDGCALHVLARSAWTRNIALPIDVVSCAIADAALGLSAAHELTDPDSGAPLNVVHRDISPDNLMINKEGVTKILDFGVAKQTGSEKTVAGELRGKLPFMSPEQIRGKKIDRRADIYALGVTFYWLVTGRRPFVADNEHALMHTIVTVEPTQPKRWNPALSNALDQLIMGMLAKDPDKRPSDAGVVHDALADALKTRRSLVVPFVRDILAGELASNSAVAVTPAFIAPKSAPGASVSPLASAATATDDDDEALYDPEEEDGSDRATTAPNPIVRTQPNSQPDTQLARRLHDAPTLLRSSSSPSSPGKAPSSPGKTAAPSPSGKSPSSPGKTAAPAPSGKSPPSPGKTAAPAPSGKSPPSPGKTAAHAPSGKSPPSPGKSAPSVSPAVSAALQGDGLATVSLTSADVEAAMAQAHTMMVDNERRMAAQAMKAVAEKSGATFDDSATVRLTSEDIAAALASIKPGVLEASLAGTAHVDDDGTADVAGAPASVSERTADISTARVRRDGTEVASEIVEFVEEPAEPTMLVAAPIDPSSLADADADDLADAIADDVDDLNDVNDADDAYASGGSGQNSGPAIAPGMQALFGRHTPATPARSIERPVESSGPIAASPGRPHERRAVIERSSTAPVPVAPMASSSSMTSSLMGPSSSLSSSSPSSPSMGSTASSSPSMGSTASSSSSSSGTPPPGKSGELHQLLESMAPDSLLLGTTTKKPFPVVLAAAGAVGLVLVLAIIVFVATRPDAPADGDTPVDVQPDTVDAKPLDTPTDAQPTDATPGKPVDAKAIAVKPVDANPVDAKPVAVKPTQNVETNPFNSPDDLKLDVKPIDKPVDVKPVDKPVDVKPVDKPADKPDPKPDRPKSVDKPKPAEPKIIDVAAQAPAGIQWFAGAKQLGKGGATFQLPADTTSLIAVDSKRGGRATVPIVNGVANYGALPKGKIHPRANPFAEVFLGSELLGTTPFAAVEVVAGKYTLRFVSEGKEEQRIVEVNAGETVKVAVDFTAP